MIFIAAFDIDNLIREADEKLAIQRKREAEIEAKLAAKKAGTRLPDRSAPVRSEPTEQAAGGPPVLALGGSKPSWRERQAAKAAEAASGGSAPAPAPAAPAQAPAESAPASDEAPAPRRSGYVPPHLRGDTPRGRPEIPPAPAGRDESSGGDKWRSRTKEAPRDGPGPREQSSGTDKFVPRFRREGAEARSETPPARTDSPAAPSAGKYVPRHLRDKQ